MSNSLEIITTGDGSQSLINTDLNETYHSTHGAVQESAYVFIQKGLQYFLECNPESINILEIGFGTGLNVLLSIDVAENVKKQTKFTTVDSFPLPESVWMKLNFTVLPANAHMKEIHSSPWNVSIRITPFFELTKISASVQAIELKDNEYDIIYYDAFAPSKQPEMWELPILKKMFDALKHQGVFVTYCAKGQVKRDLKSLGFEVETLVGPPGKKEMIRAIKP